MSRLWLISICTCCLVAGCTSGTDDSIPPTLQALNDLQEGVDADGTDDSVSRTLQAVNDLQERADAEANRATPTEAPELPADVTASGIYQVEFITTEGKFLVEVNREWAPIGADRFYKLVTEGFYDDCAFFRVVEGFVVQFGLPADPTNNARWAKGLLDEPVIKGNKRGFLTYAKSGAPNSRTTQLFINLGDNARLDADGFSVFGQVSEGMDVVDRLNGEYGEAPSRAQGQIRAEGNAFLQSSFPNLSYVQTARVTNDDLAPETLAE